MIIKFRENNSNDFEFVYFFKTRFEYKRNNTDDGVPFYGVPDAPWCPLDN